MNTTISLKIDLKTKSLLTEYANINKLSNSQVIREALKTYISSKGYNAGFFLLQMGNDAKKVETKAPTDLSSNMNKYLYDQEN